MKVNFEKKAEHSERRREEMKATIYLDAERRDNANSFTVYISYHTGACI